VTPFRAFWALDNSGYLLPQFRVSRFPESRISIFKSWFNAKTTSFENLRKPLAKNFCFS